MLMKIYADVLSCTKREIQLKCCCDEKWRNCRAKLWCFLHSLIIDLIIIITFELCTSAIQPINNQDLTTSLWFHCM